MHLDTLAASGIGGVPRDDFEQRLVDGAPPLRAQEAGEARPRVVPGGRAG
ncbi:hypothetical protein ACIRP2_30740 [Streptomyces sp. NPDC101194]